MRKLVLMNIFGLQFLDKIAALIVSHFGRQNRGVDWYQSWPLHHRNSACLDLQVHTPMLYSNSPPRFSMLPPVIRLTEQYALWSVKIYAKFIYKKNDNIHEGTKNITLFFIDQSLVLLLSKIYSKPNKTDNFSEERLLRLSLST